jgi:hypothetical protein
MTIDGGDHKNTFMRYLLWNLRCGGQLVTFYRLPVYHAKAIAVKMN